ncbi:MAG TPA: hypothetical protein VHY78_02720 [Stellaceae bacterium]|jgi:hypothetical protein|nr:hypothetical protein [Stellaceae bacterium]
MTDIQIATADGTGKVLEDATVEAFRVGLRGPLLSPGDAGYCRWLPQCQTRHGDTVQHDPRGATLS